MELPKIKRFVINSSGVFLCEDEVKKVFESQQKEIETLKREKEEQLIELEEAIKYCSNIKTFSYNLEFEEWEITYKNGLKPNLVPTNLIIEFLNNA